MSPTPPPSAWSTTTADTPKASPFKPIWDAVSDNGRRSTLRRLSLIVGIVLTVVSVIIALILTWYWALNGISSEIGGATGITTAILFIGGVIAWLVGALD